MGTSLKLSSSASASQFSHMVSESLIHTKMAFLYKMANLSTLRHSQMLMRLGEDKVNKYRTTVDSVDKHHFLSTDVNRLGVDKVLLRNFSFFTF